MKRVYSHTLHGFFEYPENGWIIDDYNHIPPPDAFILLIDWLYNSEAMDKEKIDKIVKTRDRFLIEATCQHVMENLNNNIYNLPEKLFTIKI